MQFLVFIELLRFFYYPMDLLKYLIALLLSQPSPGLTPGRSASRGTLRGLPPRFPFPKDEIQSIIFQQLEARKRALHDEVRLNSVKPEKVEFLKKEILQLSLQATQLRLYDKLAILNRLITDGVVGEESLDVQFRQTAGMALIELKEASPEVEGLTLCIEKCSDSMRMKLMRQCDFDKVIKRLTDCSKVIEREII